MSSAIALKRPRTKAAEVRREELMDAAQTLFIDKGFDATSVDEIVRAADVAKGTFYCALQDQGRAPCFAGALHR